MLIKASNYIKTGFSISDAEALLNAIQDPISKQDKVTIDFSDITIFTTLFFNNALAKFLVEFGPEKYDKMFELTNLSEVGMNTYQHSLENAREYYQLSTSDKEKQEHILANLDE